MTIVQITVKFLGRTDVLYRVMDSNGTAVQVFCTLNEAQDWVDYK